MPVFEAAVPLSKAQKRRRWIAASVIVGASIGFAIWAAIDCAHIDFGYAASYSFAMVFLLGCFFAVTGTVLMIYWRTRSTGVALLGSGIAMYLIFLGCIGFLKKFDKVTWQHEPPAQHFGPDQQASLVIYYRPGTTDQQIEDFVEHKLESYPSKVHDGTDFPDFVTEYLGLLPSQANGFSGSALTLKAGAHGAAVDSFVAMVQFDPRVARVFRDIAPDDIHLPKGERAPMRPSQQLR
ncbi:hypothetical protein [Granulicella mallensis]|uniref:Uncharacterized protein n=1 Tax=Granulicella mallensis TaxID=940614 RepID=A0A7W7ZRQ7_9BACT|nr:hypothetical protein [Granulicella mallensis]MBB5064942.1 hypothetical protein [Granulicella mallensis]